MTETKNKYVSRWYKRYRIFQENPDLWNFKVQAWRIWWPFWVDCYFGLTFPTLEIAMLEAQTHQEKFSIRNIISWVMADLKKEYAAWRAKPRPKKWRA